MGKSRSRHHSHRTSTPSVICLPPPKPPITVPRKEPEVERAIRLAQVDEPLVIYSDETVSGSFETRQMRRKARRAEARAAKRLGAEVAAEFAAAQEQEAVELPVLNVSEHDFEDTAVAESEIAAVEIPEPPTASEAAVSEPAMTLTPPPEPRVSESQPIAMAAAGEPDTAPLPRSQALAKQPTGIVARLNAWFARLVPVQKARKVQRVSQDTLAEQMLALRGELAMVQGRLDRMIAAVTAS